MEIENQDWPDGYVVLRSEDGFWNGRAFGPFTNAVKIIPQQADDLLEKARSTSGQSPWSMYIQP